VLALLETKPLLADWLTDDAAVLLVVAEDWSSVEVVPDVAFDEFAVAFDVE
jgi:hypothetical protein